MVHTFGYTYGDKKYYFLWDVESGSLIEVDYVAFLYAKKRYGKTFSSTEEKDFSVIAKNDLDELAADFDELEKDLLVGRVKK